MSTRDANALPGRPGRRIEPNTQREIQSRTPGVVGNGDTIIHTHNGAVISTRKKQRAKAVVNPLTIKSGSEAGKYQIVPGKVNSLTPTLDTIAIDAEEKPEFTAPDGVTTYAWIKVVGTFGTPDSYVITIEVNDTSDPPSEDSITATDFTSCYPIGLVLDGVISNDTSGGNLGVESFGGVNLWWKR